MSKVTDNQSITVEKSFTKADWLSYIANMTGLSQKDVDAVLKAIPGVIKAHLKKGIPCSFIGLLKFSVVEKEGTPEQKRPNPFTGEMTTFAAKPPHQAPRAKILKGFKDMVNEGEA